MDGKLLRPEEIEGWIHDHDDWIEPPEKMLELQYLVWLPDKEEIDTWWFDIDPDSVLGRLYYVAKEIKDAHCPHWDHAEAVTFVLCGQYPEPRRVLFETVRSETMPAASLQIKMVIDPRVSIKEVSDVYARSRNLLLGIERSSKSKPRSMSDKHLKLALFTEKNRGTGTWDVLRKKWNKGRKRGRMLALEEVYGLSRILLALVAVSLLLRARRIVTGE